MPSNWQKICCSPSFIVMTENTSGIVDVYNGCEHTLARYLIPTYKDGEGSI